MGLGLRKLGAGRWRGDGSDGDHFDYNSEILESVIVNVQNNITEITETVQNIQIVGGGDASFVFTQNVASATWRVPHGLGKFPAVTVVDSSGHEVVGDVNHDSPNQLTVIFSAPFAGSAYLN